MKHHITKLIMLIISFFIAFNTGLLRAEERYVSDQLKITMRSGQGAQFKILRMLKSGTPLTIIKQDQTSGYSHVKTKRGAEGWVLTRYLMSSPAARTQLEKINQQSSKLQQDKKDFQQQSAKTTTYLGDLEKNNKTLQINNRSLSQELEDIHKTASSAIAINNENKNLKSRLMKIERAQQNLQQEYNALKDHTARDWFMVGGGVLLLGIIAGLILPRFQWRRRQQDWGSL